MTDERDPEARSPETRFRAPDLRGLAELAAVLAAVDEDVALVPALLDALRPYGVEDASVAVDIDGERVVFPTELGDGTLGDPRDERRQLPIEQTPIGEVFRTDEPAAWTTEAIEAEYPLLHAKRIRSGALLFVPVRIPAAETSSAETSSAETPLDHGAWMDGTRPGAWHPGRALLILALHERSVTLDDETRDAFRLVAHLVGAALARLGQEGGRARAILRRGVVTRAVAELLPPGDPETIRGRIIDLALSLTGAERAVLLVREDEELVVVASRGLTEEQAQSGERFPLDGGTVVAEAARTGRPVVTARPAAYLARFPSMAGRFLMGGNRALVGIPLSAGDRPLGVLGLGFGEAYEPTPAELDALSAFGGAAAWAIEAARLRAAEAQTRRTLEQVLDQMPLAVAVADETGRLVDANERVAAIWGDVLDTEGPEGYGEWIGFHADGRRYRWDEWPLVRSLDGETVDGEEIAIQRFDGGRAITRQWSGPIRDETGATRGAVVVLADITIEAEAARMRDAFIDVLSHELRTPVTTIYGNAHLLGRPSLTPEMRAELVADVAAESDRLLRMVQDLLVLARVERGVAVGGDDPISLERAVARTVAGERRLRPALSIELHAAPGVPLVTGDEGYLEQVLRNLVSNAAKYGRGRIVVSVGPVPGGASVAVADDGPGFPAETRERVWDLFWRGPDANRQPGAGIGLYVCRRLVEAMGGTIAASNQPDGGGLVVVTLPARAEVIDEE